MTDTLTTIAIYLGIVIGWTALFWLIFRGKNTGATNTGWLWSGPISSPMAEAWSVDYLILQGYTRAKAERMVREASEGRKHKGS